MEDFADAIIIGAGAAGFFASIACKEELQSGKVLLIEKTKSPLAKVRISGGGRCNVTHSCFEPKSLITNYPRGGRELLGPFSKFQPRDTINWYKSRGIELKTEEDGRMFPATDSSETIIEALYKAAKKCGVELFEQVRIESLQKDGQGFFLKLRDGKILGAKMLLIATGSAKEGHQFAKALGHAIEPLCPSLFSFNVPDFALSSLAGVSSLASVKLKKGGFRFDGPVLVTHTGFSGPAILKLSSFEAKILSERQYETEFVIDWTLNAKEEEIRQKLFERKKMHPKKSMISDSLFSLSKSLWKALLLKAKIPIDMTWGGVSRALLESAIKVLTQDTYCMKGKTPYKHEFVTCGGIKLAEVDFRKMESKLVPNLYFAGEVLDIDGITGGFNFQAAWTTGWIAGKSMAKKLQAPP